MKTFLNDVIKKCLGTDARLLSVRPVAGGDINMAYACKTNHGNVFIKVNKRAQRDMFDTEQRALNALKQNSDFVVPDALGVIESHNQAALVLEYLNLSALTSQGYYTAGAQLAQLHRKRQPFFGWECDNYIGTTPQLNPATEDWLSFLIHSRLLFQMERLNHRDILNYGNDLPKLSAYFDDYEPFPSLLHGDLWPGNIAGNDRDEPVIFDPASYYGDREMDIAMTELFGGFPQAFYQGYQAVWPLATGYAQRKPIYFLYHILNHANLFGAHYIRRAEVLLKQLLLNH